jgi:hypothetical protein
MRDEKIPEISDFFSRDSGATMFHVELSANRISVFHVEHSLVSQVLAIYVAGNESKPGILVFSFIHHPSPLNSLIRLPPFARFAMSKTPS